MTDNHCSKCRSGYTQSPLPDLCATCKCHKESDLDRFVKENPKECIDCKKCGDSVVVPKGRVYCFQCKE